MVVGRLKDKQDDSPKHAADAMGTKLAKLKEAVRHVPSTRGDINGGGSDDTNYNIGHRSLEHVNLADSLCQDFFGGQKWPTRFFQ